jgi:hypothetical protein
MSFVEIAVKLVLRIASESVSVLRRRRRGWDVWHRANSSASASVLNGIGAASLCGLIGGLHPAVRRFMETGLRVRPPPSLLRGLQAPPGSLSPLGGAALIPQTEAARTLLEA